MSYELITNDSSKPFDNRLSLNKSLHLKFDLYGITFLYCYIRKNACSSFKRMLYSAHPLFSSQKIKGDPLNPLLSAFKVPLDGESISAPVRLFVYRDPIDRIVSVYNDKFVMGRGNTDIFGSVRQTLNVEPASMTFAEFVFDYLAAGLERIDAHCVPQNAHLWPIVYTHAIPLDMLYPTMGSLLGDDIAQVHFGKPLNSSLTKRTESPASDVPADVLQKQWRENRTTPSRKALLNPEIRRTLQTVYASDFSLIRRIKHQSS